MAVNTQLSSLMNKEVTRKEFLAMSGLAVVAALGLGSITKLVTGKSLADHSAVKAYSSGAYGGSKDGH